MGDEVAHLVRVSVSVRPRVRVRVRVRVRGSVRGRVGVGLVRDEAAHQSERLLVVDVPPRRGKPRSLVPPG